MENLMQQSNKDLFPEYYSAEFQLNQSKILYHFKIRKSPEEPMFAVVKEGSKALEGIKEGDIINVRYYSLDRSVPSQSRDTKIKYICKDSSVGFKDHYVIGLDLHTQKEAKTA